MHTSIHSGGTGNIRHSPRNGFNSLYVISPGTGLSCPRRSRGIASHENLAPASGRQDHTISPSASAAFVNAQPQRPPHPASNVRDDRETPLLWRRDTQKMLLIWGFEQYCRPAAQWHDGQFTHDMYARSARRAKWRFTHRPQQRSHSFSACRLSNALWPVPGKRAPGIGSPTTNMRNG
jgi:hypothetical protein